MGLFGFGKCDITPETGCLLYGYVDDLVSESIHDRLAANAFYFEDKGVSSFLITCDVCSINTIVSQKIRKAVSELTGTPFENIILHGIHNHTGPNTDGNTGWGDLDIPYCENILLPGILNACKRAVETKCEALVGVSIGKSDIGVNRREIDINNNCIFGQSPWGCYDPRMAVFSFTDTDEKPVANLIFYTCHGTCAGVCKEISRDFSGGMVDALAEFSGAPTAFFCGAEGDAGPRLPNGQTVGTIKDVEEMGLLAGKDAVDIYKKIDKYSPLEMKAAHTVLELPLKKRISLSEAKSLYERFKDFTVNLEGQTRSYASLVIDSYTNGYDEAQFRLIPQSAILINDSIFVAFPYEIFSEIALRIDREFKNHNIFSLSNANGSEGYFPTHSELSKGGYEIDMFLTGNVQPFTDHADWHLIKETLRNLEELVCTE